MSLNYELIDFGEGRKLESLCGYLIDRPSPAAIDSSRRYPEQWQAADARFDDHARQWNFSKPWPPAIFLDGGKFQLPFRATPFGHIGAFPEQRPNWQWLVEVAARLQTLSTKETDSASQFQALNLFAHTGGSTFALASTGCSVTHVDAAKPNVTAAREAAETSGLGNSSIRYIIDDARKFTTREIRRKRTYDIIVLDPPGYGHSPAGKAWRIERDLWPLIDACLELLNPNCSAILITGHSVGIDQNFIADYLKRHSHFRDAQARLRIDCGRSQLSDRADRKLDAGFYVRVISDSLAPVLRGES